MMGRIALLDPGTVNLIAAGEVIERPAAVVKELVENALDAGAQRIHIELMGGGLERIVVIDDGWGMEKDDAVLAFERHATSKIRQADDLGTIATLGFRGEALPSIAAVARVTLRSCVRGALAGVEVRVEGGRLTGQGPIGTPVGTSVTVADLFFNTPARLKFLRSPSFEGGVCGDVAGKLALARPDVAFSLTMNGRKVFTTPGRGKLEEAIAGVFGAATAEEMVPVAWEEGHYTLEGFAGRTTLTRSSRRQQVLIINGRYVKSYILAGAIDGAYRDLIPPKRHPVVVLRVTADPRMVDVNVHPAKLEVKVAHQSVLNSAAFSALQTALGRAEPPSALAGRGPSFPVSGENAIQQMAKNGFVGHFGGSAGQVGETLAFYVPVASSPLTLRFLGCLSPTYLLAEGADGLYIVDQHVAHERVLFEEVLEQLSARKGETQMLATVVSLELEPRDGALVHEHEQLLRQVGFILEFFGGATFVLRGVPALGDEVDPEQLLRDFLCRLGEGAGCENGLDGRHMLAAGLACHRAVRAGTVLNPVEAQRLLDRLTAAKEPALCPHGRPTYLKLTRAELARRFGRE